MLLQRQGAGEGSGDNLWKRPELMLAKVEGPFMEVCHMFTTEAADEPGAIRMDGARNGIVVLGSAYSTIEVNDSCIVRRSNLQASKDGEEKIGASVKMEGGKVWLRVIIKEGGDLSGGKSVSDIPLICDFQYSFDGQHFSSLGPLFQGVAGRWIGAKVGAFSL